MAEIQVESVDYHTERSEGIKAKVKTANGFTEGLNAWQSSFQGEVEEKGFAQAWVDHWRSLKTLHKHHIRPKEGDKKDIRKDAVSNAIATAAKIHMFQHGDVPTVGAMVRAAAPLASDHAPSPAVAGTTPPPNSFSDSSFKSVVEADGKPVDKEVNLTFKNWGLTVQNTPSVTFMPTSRTGVQNIVKWAIKNNKKVRASGYRHTWTDMYSSNDQVLISMLPLKQATHIPVLRSVPITPNEDDLEGIQIVGTIKEDGVEKALCKIGASTTNDQFREWCLDKKNGGKWKWTIPLNVIMVEITWGGSNAPICHGAGLKQQTLSDLVTEIEFVNVHGDVQVVNDPEQLRAAAGAFGLLGIVTHVTLKLDPMTYAAMRPAKIPTMLAIPPPKGWEAPEKLKSKKFSSKQLEKAKIEFEQHCEKDYYAEWFWFPYQDDCWVNCWQNDGLEKDAKTIPEWKVLSQDIQGMLGNAFNVTLGKLSGAMQTWVLAWSAMAVLPNVKPDEPSATVPLIEALHFRRGIQNMRVIDMELEIPIPGRKDDPTKPDWSICQKAWWTVINAAYKYKERGEYPLRVALEMRVMGGSNIIMAPQYGNDLGTCSIEILTTPETDPVLWRTFMQEIADVWTSYTDLDGSLLNTRSHWAKQWQELTIHDVPAQQYFRDTSYRHRIREFKKQLELVGAAGKFTLDDMKERFSNSLLDYLYFKKQSKSTAAPAPVAAPSDSPKKKSKSDSKTPAANTKKEKDTKAPVADSKKEKEKEKKSKK